MDFVKKTAILVALMALGLGCGQSGDKDAAPAKEPTQLETITVAAVNYPLTYFAERIGGDRVKVKFLAPKDEDPAFWMPDQDAIEKYQKADLILLNGATYAKWIEKVSLPVSRCVNTSESFEAEYLKLEEAVKHSHGPGGEHAHVGTDFNTWMDPTLAVQQARAVATALVKHLPEDSSRIEANFGALKSDLEMLDRVFADAASSIGDEPLLASHPVYGYFAKRYNLNLRSRMWEPGEMPSNHEWQELDRILKGFQARWMIWEGDPIPEIVEELSRRGVSVVVVKPSGNRLVDGDYLEVMRQNVERFKAIK